MELLKIGVVGLGTMGSGIVEVIARSGYSVIDWQSYGASSPGIEMHQLFDTLKTEADYVQLPALK